MIRSQRINLLAVLGAAGLCATFLQSNSAFAGDRAPRVLTLAHGLGGEDGDYTNGTKDAGPGNEQGHTAWITRDGGNTIYLVSVYMSSNVQAKDAPWQCKCSSVMLTKDGATVGADQVQLTYGAPGDRPCNHARIASDGSHMVWTYGTDDNNNNVQTYAQGIDENCKLIGNPVLVSENNNNNEGAPDIVGMVTYDSKNLPVATNYFTMGYLSTGNNDTSYAVILMVDSMGNVTKQGNAIPVVTPSNIGRPTIENMDGRYALFCAAQGNNRPPEDGVACAVLDSHTGTIMGNNGKSMLVANSDPGNNKYANQPQVGRLDGGNYAIMWVESNGAGKNSNDNHQKGTSIAHLDVWNIDTQGNFNLSSTTKDVGSYQTHASLCTSRYGTMGQRYAAIMTAPASGVGLPYIQYASYGGSGIKIDTVKDNYQIGFHGDSGYLSNIFGQNPHQQGRDFLRCLGDIPNPGHSVGPFMPDVKSFVVAPHSGREDGGYNKNAQYLALVPAEVDSFGAPQPPTNDTETTSATSSAVTTATVATSATTSTGSGVVNSGTSGAGGGGSVADTSTPNASSGCACSTPGDVGDTNGLGAFVGLGLAALFASRRRKEA